MDAPDTITCVECGGVCRRVSYPPPDEGFEFGDAVAYVCDDCGNRFDVVFEADED
jgi:predicted nucleic acid-binding Zn ribbon protein